MAIQRQEKKKRTKQTQYSAPDSSTPLTVDSNPATYGIIESSTLQEGSVSDLEQGAYSVDHEPPTLRALLTPEVVAVLVNYGLFTFLEMSFQVLIPLMWSTSVALGGLGFTPYKIGLTMGIYGLVNALMQIIFLGRLIRRFGPRKVYRVAFSCLFVSFASFPIAGFFSRRAGGPDWRVWCIIVIQLTAAVVVSSAIGKLSFFPFI